MTSEEIDKVEQIAQERINEDLSVTWKNMNLDDAKKLGAMALFGEKYGEVVRVVTTGEPSNIFSMELCGGTHVDHTSDIGDIFITQETAIAAGMRRIEALTGNGAAKFLAEQKEIVSQIREYLKKDLDSLAEGDITKFKALVGNAHRRILHKEGLLSQIEDFQGRFEKRQRQKIKEDQARLSTTASEIEPAANLDGGKLKLFVFNDNQSAKLYADIFSAKSPEATVAAISGSTGTFAIKSPDYSSSQSVFEDMREFGARGGGKPTISGSMPKDNIDAFIGKVREKFK
jgi:alanyl-tRNA synthetase